MEPVLLLGSPGLTVASWFLGFCCCQETETVKSVDKFSKIEIQAEHYHNICKNRPKSKAGEFHPIKKRKTFSGGKSIRDTRAEKTCSKSLQTQYFSQVFTHPSQGIWVCYGHIIYYLSYIYIYLYIHTYIYMHGLLKLWVLTLPTWLLMKINDTR